MKNVLIATLFLFSSLLYGCGYSVPDTFIQTNQPGWRTIELREELEYQRAWDTVLELIVKKFDIDKAIKEEGYILTDWTYTWSGAYLKYYRVRVTIKFTPDKEQIQLKPEAQFLKDEEEGIWVVGWDSQLLNTLKTDIMGTVGRTTR